MKLTKTQLKQIIKEELEATMEEEVPMQENFMQDAAMKILNMLSPGLAETAELAREYPEFAKAVARHSEGPEAKAVSSNLQIAGGAGGSGSSQLRRALEKDEAEVVRALDDFVAGGGSSSRAFAMALPRFLEGGDKIDLNLGMGGSRFRKR
tara:strand:- start:588 stop:1040 length:453 start_codon:yes stop_codon:yes gene_type:complete